VLGDSGTLAEGIPMSTALGKVFFNMIFLVLEMLRAIEESFSTFAALLRHFSNVNSDEDGAFTEGFPTQAALIRPISSVNFLVFNKVRSVAEGFPAFTALIRSFSSVNLWC
jgi:hypothetical protein